MSLLKLLALSHWPIFFAISFYLFRKSALKFSIHSYSDLGSSPSVSGFQFNSLLVSSGLIQLCLLSQIALLPLLNVFPSRLALIFLIVTSICGILTGIIKLNQNSSLHLTFGTLGFICASLGWSILGFFLLTQKYNFSGIFFLAYGLLAVPQVGLVYIQRHTAPARYESLIFLGAFFTNLFLLI